MRVRFYPAKRSETSRSILQFLTRNQVTHELVRAEEFGSAKNLYKSGEVPFVEVDGRLFVNPNDEALKKILHIA